MCENKGGKIEREEKRKKINNRLLNLTRLVRTGKKINIVLIMIVLGIILYLSSDLVTPLGTARDHVSQRRNRCESRSNPVERIVYLY